MLSQLEIAGLAVAAFALFMAVYSIWYRRRVR